MASIGFAEILLLIVFGSGDLQPDLLALVPPHEYFKARSIEPTIEKMMELAVKEPRDPKSQVQQILALRHLDAEIEQFKKSPKLEEFRTTLKQIESGKLVADPQGSSKTYATQVLARLDGKKLTIVDRPTRLKEGFAWFPADSTVVYGMDLSNREKLSRTLNPLDELAKNIPPQIKEQIFNFIDQLGNIHVDRLTFGLNIDPQGNQDKHEIYIRVTGKLNPDWITDVLHTNAGWNIERKKNGADKLIYLTMPGDPDQLSGPALLLINDHDLIVGGYTAGKAANREVVEKALAIRAQVKPNVTQGKLKERIEKSAKAGVLLVADVPTSILSPNVPTWIKGLDKVDATMAKTKAGVELHAKVVMTQEAIAKEMVDAFSMKKDQAIEMLKTQKTPAHLQLTVDSVIQTLTSVKLDQQKSQVVIQAIISPMALQALPMYFMGSAPVRPAE